MTKEALDSIIGKHGKKKVRDMGGVMSTVFTVGVMDVVLGVLTPEEGLKIFQWGVKMEEELERSTDPSEWTKIRQDSMKDGLLRERGEKWFKKMVNRERKTLGEPEAYSEP